MKFFFTFLILTLSQLSFAKSLQVIDVEYGFEDYLGKPTLCLSTYRDLDTNQNIALIEDLTDCFWGRKSKQKLGQVMNIPNHVFTAVESPKLAQHLLSFDSKLEFYYSDNE